MNDLFKNILVGVITAAIVANVAVLFQFNARLASIETKLQIVFAAKIQTINQNHQNE